MIEKTIARLRDGHAVLASPTRLNGAYVFEALALGAIGMSITTFAILTIDDGTVSGEPVWLKPFKFAVSFAVLFATLGFAAGRLSSGWCHSRLIVATAGASAATFLLEITSIAAQAVRKEAFRFDESTPFHAAMHAPTGHAATVLMAAIALVGLVVWSDRAARLAPGLRLGLGLGFLLTSILTLWVAGELEGNGGPFVGAPSDLDARLPLLGWSMEIGDLRPAHFLSLHAMQVLPLAGHLADRSGASVRSVWMAAVLYAILTAIVFHQALLGIPVISA